MNNNISILIVEDELELLNRLVKYISIFCDIIYQASDGKEGLDLFVKHRPNIILSDINMPQLRGVEFIEAIRKIDQNTQIIILSAYTDTEDFLKIIPLNLVEYLVKPIQMNQLKQTIIKAISNSSVKNTILLECDYVWNSETKSLYFENEKINLTKYENAFVEILVLKINNSVSYGEIHNHIYDLEDYSQDAIFSLVKKIRKKTKKELIKSSYKYGYVIESK